MTHYFTPRTDEKPSHDYYDVGAMRFPMVPIMDRTFDLFLRTEVNKKLIPYYMRGLVWPPIEAVSADFV